MAGTRGRSASQSQQKEDAREQDGGGGKGGKVEGGRCSKIAGKSNRLKQICEGGPNECGVVREKIDWIECVLCKLWYHSHCQGLSEEAFMAHKQYDFVWLCIDCKPRFLEITEGRKEIVARLDQVEKSILSALKSEEKVNAEKRLETKIANMEKIVELIREQQTKTDEALKEQREAVRVVPKVSEELKKSAHELKAFVKSKEEKETRDKNILLHNIPECESENAEERKSYAFASFHNVVSALFDESEAKKWRQSTSSGLEKEQREPKKENQG